MTTASELEAQAAAWLVKRDTGHLSAADQAELDAWLEADPRARATYMRLELAWKRADGLRRLRPLDGDVDEDLLAHSPFEPVPMDEYPARQGTGKTSELMSSPVRTVIDAAIVEHKPRRRWAIVSAAAALLALATIGGFIWRAYELTGWHEYTTDYGGLSRIVLDDGSVVNLNTNSLIRVQLTRELRHIVLERGEALFKVAHEKLRPFDVEAANTTVRAVGTEFSVRLREPAENAGGAKDVVVLVKEGRVSIDPPKITTKPVQRVATLPPSTSTLSAGEAVTITTRNVSTEQPQMQVQKIADVDKKLSWTEGRLWFERQTLKDVVAEFNRYNRRQMVIADPAIEDLRIGGGFEATDQESFIAALEKTLGIRAFPSPPSDGDQAEVIRLVGTRENQN
jgi:transmembrane sensor